MSIFDPVVCRLRWRLLCPPTLREEAAHVALIEIVTIGHENASASLSMRVLEYDVLRMEKAAYPGWHTMCPSS